MLLVSMCPNRAVCFRHQTLHSNKTCAIKHIPCCVSSWKDFCYNCCRNQTEGEWTQHGSGVVIQMTCLQCLLCDNLKCETRDAAVANPDCQAQQNQEVCCWMGLTAKLCFPPCERVVSVRKRKQECSIPQQQSGSYFSFQSTAECRNATSQARWCYYGFKQGDQPLMNVKVFVSLGAVLETFHS